MESEALAAEQRWRHVFAEEEAAREAGAVKEAAAAARHAEIAASVISIEAEARREAEEKAATARADYEQRR